MDYYAIDITKPRIQKAMANLGIEEDELLIKVPDDFGGKESTDEIRQMRFNYFERKQLELVRQIKSFVKDDILRNREKALKNESKAKQSGEILITSTAEILEDNFIKTKNNFRKIVDKTIVDVKEAFLEKKAIEDKLKVGERNRKKAQSAVSKNRVKIEELKEKQKENMRIIRENERKKLGLYYRSACSASPKRFRSTNRLQETRSRSSSIQEPDIDEKISQYEEKMNRSKILYELTIQSKKNAVAKLLERNEKKSKTPEKELNMVEKISKIIQKNKTAEDKRFLYMKQMAESREKNKEKQNERRQRAKSRIKEQELVEKQKGKEFEKKMKISNSLMQQKHCNWVKELELRSEMQRLRDEEALNNAERKKRIM